MSATYETKMALGESRIKRAIFAYYQRRDEVAADHITEAKRHFYAAYEACDEMFSRPALDAFAALDDANLALAQWQECAAQPRAEI